MIRYLCASLVTVALGLAATSVHADVSDERSERPVVFLDAGAASSIRELDQVGSKRGTGFSAGGGVGFPLNERFTLPLDELRWEPRIQPNEIGVAVKDGVVTLTGWVDSYTKRWAAEDAAHRVRGVKAVANDIEIRLPGSAERTDADIAAAATRALEWDAFVDQGGRPAGRSRRPAGRKGTYGFGSLFAVE